MSAFKDTAFTDRLSTAADAKRAALENFRARTASGDPAAIERQATRVAISTARETRLAERRATREAEAARQALELAAQNAELAARNAALEAERKAARDARYAARKARAGKTGLGRGR